MSDSKARRTAHAAIIADEVLLLGRAPHTLALTEVEGPFLRVDLLLIRLRQLPPPDFKT